MLNQVTVMGRLGAIPEIKEFTGGNKVASLSVASWESYWDKNKTNEQTGQLGAWNTITEWHRVNVWGEAADRCAKMNKGDMVIVTGKIKTRSWDGTDGQKHYATEIVGYVKSLPKTQGNSPAGHMEQANQASNYEAPTDGDGDDLPF